MKAISFSAFAVLAGAALLSLSCSSADVNGGQLNCSPPCANGFECIGNNQCIRISGNNTTGGFGSSSGSATGGSGVTGAGAGGSATQNGTGGGFGGGNNGSNFGSGGTSSGSGGSNFGSGGTSSGSSAGAGGTSGGTSHYCAACSSDATCGGGNNFCLAFSFGNYCGTDCSNGQACPSGATCQQIGDGSGNVAGMNCVPTTSCPGSGAGGAGGTSSGSGGSGSGGTSSGGSGSSGACTTDTWANFGQAFFQNYCDTCHGGAFSSHSSVQSELGTISGSISNNMPPSGLSSSMRSRILKYLNCGAP